MSLQFLDPALRSKSADNASIERELLHHKLDQLREQEVLELSKAVANLTAAVKNSGTTAA